MRTLGIYSLHTPHIQNRLYSSANTNHLVAGYIPSTYLSQDWKLVPFDYLPPIS